MLLSYRGFALFTLLQFGLLSCAPLYYPPEEESTAPKLTKTGVGAATGAAVGAGFGALIGSTSGHVGEGLAVGTLAGAAAGGAIGYGLEQKDQSLKQTRQNMSAKNRQSRGRKKKSLP